MVKEITDSTFEQEVLKSTLPVLVDFWAPWCKPCNMVAPITEKLSQEYAGRLKVCKLNVDHSQQIAAKYSIMSIPTLIFFNGGKPVDTIIGAMPESIFKKKVENLL